MNTVRLVYCMRTESGVMKWRSELTAEEVAALFNADDAERLPAPRHWYGWWEADKGE